jgi:hypothetical protein
MRGPIGLNRLLRSAAAYWAKRRLARSALDSRDEQTPLREELFSADQMEQHGKALAATHTLSRSGGRDRLLQRLDENEQVLNGTCSLLLAAVGAQRRIAPAGEWLLDNFYLIEEQVRTARQHLPAGYSRELPRLAQGASGGLPRVYDLALEAIAHGDGRVDADTLARFISAYQTVTPLTLGELWAIPIMLRLALIENLRRVGARITADRIHCNQAQDWATQMMEIAASDPKSLILVIAPAARPRAGPGPGTDLDRATPGRIEPDHRADGGGGEPAAGGGPGVDQQYRRQPALPRIDRLASVRRGHEPGRAGLAR